MQTAIALFSVLTTLEDNLVLVELPLFDRDVDLDDILPHNSSSSNIKVSSCPISVSELDQRNDDWTVLTLLRSCP